MLGHHIVKSGEIAVQRTFAVPGAVAAVVIKADFIEPGRCLDVGLTRRDIGGVGIVGPRQPGEILNRSVPDKTGVDGLARNAAPALDRVVTGPAIAAVIGRAFAILDHVGCVIDHDVQIDLHAAGVSGVDEGPEL